jgi:excisionase family DNA binding protein
MTEPYAEALLASYDAVLDELGGAADIGRGLADLRARLDEQQDGKFLSPEEAAAGSRRMEDSLARTARAADRAGGNGDDRYLTVAEAAMMMRVSKMTVYRLVHSGELEAIRVGRSFRIPERSLNRYLTDRAGQRPHRE